MSENPVERAILIYEGVNRKKVFSIKPLGGGTANDVFLINLEDVIRLNKPNKVDSPYYSAKREYEASIALLRKKETSVIPQILAFDTEKGDKIERYIPPYVFKDEKDASYRYYLSAIESLKCFHRISGNFAPFFPVERLFRYRELSQENIREDYEEEVIRKAKIAFDSSPVVFCHNDLHNLNLVYDKEEKRMKFLDLEMAGMNYEIFDVASLLEENELDDGLCERLIHAYYGIDKVTCKTVEMVRDVMAFHDILWYYWAKARYLETMQQSFLDIAKTKMARIRSNIRKKYGNPR